MGEKGNDIILSLSKHIIDGILYQSENRKGCLSMNGVNNLAIGYKLKKIRKEKKLTLQAVSEQMDCSSAFLSMLENGRTGISLAKLQKLLDIYGCTMADLVEKETEERVVSLDNATRLGDERAAEGVESFLLVRNPKEKKLEPILFRMNPGITMGPLQHEGEEFCYIIEGSFEVTLHDRKTNTTEIYHLRSGDTIYYNSEMFHTWKNTSLTDVGVFIAAVTPSSF